MTTATAPDLEELRRTYRNDRFATEACRCRIAEATPERVVCEMDIEETHLNANGVVMGGATFTLADFALAVACNIANPPSVTLASEIRYLGTPKGAKLIATSRVDKAGRRAGFFTVDVTDELGNPVAVVTSTTFRVG